ILRHASAIVVAMAKVVLSISVTLFGSLTIPLYGFCVIPLHAFASFVAEAQIVLSQGVILLGGFAIPFHSFGVVLGHTLCMVVFYSGPKPVFQLRVRDSDLCIRCVPRKVKRVSNHA